MLLLRYEESGHEKTHQLKPGKTVVGRLPTSDLVLSRSERLAPSRDVCVADGRCFVQDAGSRFGTFLNGQRLMPTDDESPLAPGDTMKLGEVTRRRSSSSVPEQDLLTEDHEISEGPGTIIQPVAISRRDGGVDRRRAS